MAITIVVRSRNQKVSVPYKNRWKPGESVLLTIETERILAERLLPLAGSDGRVFVHGMGGEFGEGLVFARSKISAVTAPLEGGLYWLVEFSDWEEYGAECVYDLPKVKGGILYYEDQGEKDGYKVGIAVKPNGESFEVWEKGRKTSVAAAPSLNPPHACSESCKQVRRVRQDLNKGVRYQRVAEKEGATEEWIRDLEKNRVWYANAGEYRRICEKEPFDPQ